MATELNPGGQCTYCGNAYTSLELACPSCGYPTPRGQAKGNARTGRGRKIGRVGAVLVLSIAAAGGVLALAGGDDEPPSDEPTAEATPTKPPSPDGPQTPAPLKAVWDYDAGDQVSTQVAAGTSLIVSSSLGSVVSLDDTGTAQWAVSQSVSRPVVAADASGEVLVGSSADQPGIIALAAEDGQQLWFYEDIAFVDVADAGVVVDVPAKGGPFGLLDATSGAVVWSVPDVDHYAVTDSVAYVLRGVTLTAIDLQDGTTRWSVETSLKKGGSNDDVRLMANARIVVVAGPDVDVVGYATKDGAERWSADSGGGVPLLEGFSNKLLVVGTTDAVTVFDSSGPIGELPVGEPPGGSAAAAGLVPFTIEGTAYAFEPTSGTVFDESLTAVASYDGSVTPVRDGVYVNDGAQIAHYVLGGDQPDVILPVADAEARVVEVADRAVVVAGVRVSAFD